MLFELVTGRQPYTGDTPLAVAYKHVNETVPAPSSLVPGLAPAVDALVALATSRDPGLRPGDASQLLRAVFDARRQLPGGSVFAPGTEMPLTAQQGQHLAQAYPGQPGQQGPFAAPYGLVPPVGVPPAWPQAEPPAGLPAGPQAGLPEGPQAGPPAGSPAAPPPAGPPQAGATAPQQSAILGVPGVPGVPALPAFGPGRGDRASSGFGAAPQAGGEHTGFSGQPGGQNKTLIVSRDSGGHHGPRRRRSLADWLFSRRAAYLAGALAVVLVVGFLAWWQTSGRYTRVPDVAGLAAPTAAAELRNLGFKVTMGSPQADNQVPKGDVARTLPGSGGHALNGSVITVISSAGPRMISVPNVTGQAVADAQKALTAAGLIPGATQQQTSPTVPQGEVISTDPNGGTSWPQTKPVKLTVSAGIGLPDFTGQPKQAAEQWLQQHQLQVQEQSHPSGTQPAGNVIKQSPAAGTAVRQGEVITLSISAGPPVVQIPSVTGMPVHDARKELQRLGFQVNVIGFGHGRVLVCQPTGQAPKGSTITLLAGLG